MQLGETIAIIGLVVDLLALLFVVFTDWPKFKKQWQRSRSSVEKAVQRITLGVGLILGTLTLVLVILMPITKSALIVNLFLIGFSTISIVGAIPTLRVEREGEGIEKWRLVIVRLAGILLLTLGTVLLVYGSFRLYLLLASGNY